MQVGDTERVWTQDQNWGKGRFRTSRFDSNAKSMERQTDRYRFTRKTTEKGGWGGGGIRPSIMVDRTKLGERVKSFGHLYSHNNEPPNEEKKVVCEVWGVRSA